MKIVCTQSVLEAETVFSHLGDIKVIEDKLLTRESLLNADALITRSQTQINAALLKGTAVQFVGTATSGIDHIDLDYLQKHDIQFADAKGANANAVAEHVIACLQYWSEKYNKILNELTIGIIGYGCVGKQLHHLLKPASCQILINDLPSYDKGTLPQHHSVEDICKQADVISLHVPLNLQNQYSTYQMLNHNFFSQCQKQPLIINTARGDVMDYQAMLSALAEQKIQNTVLDVWPNEPNIDKQYIKAAMLATPHIAGHSVEAKWQGTYQVYLALCKYLQIKPVKQSMAVMGQQSHPIIEIDSAMNTLADAPDNISMGFNQLRQLYGNRHEQHPKAI